ncbi:hypothetical protein HN283_20885, partial [Acinetobacter baumannii]|uniref:hypothetical protein n=1 Tax=Acinetobacter baumannii TaxID=470 RepID=UPI001897310F
MWHSLRWGCAAASLLLLAELIEARVATRAVPPHDIPAPYLAGIELGDYCVREPLQSVPAHWNSERLLDTHGNT